MNNRNRILIYKSFYIAAQKAAAIPPLNTILGNIGVSTIKFCEEFNKITKTLPSYFLVKVDIIINANKTFSFVINSFSITSIINLLKYTEILYIKKNDLIIEQKQDYINLKNVLIITFFKFGYNNIKTNFNIIYGVFRSLNIKIKFNKKTHKILTKQHKILTKQHEAYIS